MYSLDEIYSQGKTGLPISSLWSKLSGLYNISSGNSGLSAPQCRVLQRLALASFSNMSIFMLTSLETLLLGGWKVLEELPEDISRLVNLRMLVFSSKQRSLPENGIGRLTSLRCLGIVSCYNLKILFKDIDSLEALQTLIIGDCPKLVSLPRAVKDLSSLEKLMFSDSEKSAKYNLEMVYSDDQEQLQSIKPHFRMLCIDGLPEVQALSHCHERIKSLRLSQFK
ncbi:hypothetical protein EZV62_003289 [Acer yangbiense]|uniref:Disease resistance R13L4/SHOC-2-like LRR domain-containing protein n=1 Tax=Acer yangbiense TaxID=1000413 RepID=A0A5C7IH81_9ROSI|nr:hypothetical protein EZV62_003289 [Acer yangbiense]